MGIELTEDIYEAAEVAYMREKMARGGLPTNGAIRAAVDAACPLIEQAVRAELITKHNATFEQAERELYLRINELEAELAKTKQRKIVADMRLEDREAELAQARAGGGAFTEADYETASRAVSEYIRQNGNTAGHYPLVVAALDAVAHRLPAAGEWRNEEGDLVALLKRAARYIQDHAANTNLQNQLLSAAEHFAHRLPATQEPAQERQLATELFGDYRPAQEPAQPADVLTAEDSKTLKRIDTSEYPKGRAVRDIVDLRDMVDRLASELTQERERGLVRKKPAQPADVLPPVYQQLDELAEKLRALMQSELGRADRLASELAQERERVRVWHGNAITAGRELADARAELTQLRERVREVVARLRDVKTHQLTCREWRLADELESAISAGKVGR